MRSCKEINPIGIEAGMFRTYRQIHKCTLDISWYIFSKNLPKDASYLTREVEISPIRIVFNVDSYSTALYRQ